MGAEKVAIVGAGDLGVLLAGRLPANCRKLIIARKRGEAVELADEVGGVASDQPTAARGADVVVLTMSAADLYEVAPTLLPTLDEKTLVVNMSPDAPTAELAASYSDRRIVGVKLVGDPAQMRTGAEGGLVFSAAAAEHKDRLLELFGGLGRLVEGTEEQATAAQAVVAEEMARAAAAARRRLEELGLAPDLVRLALSTTAPELLRLLTEEGAGGHRPGAYTV